VLFSVCLHFSVSLFYVVVNKNVPNIIEHVSKVINKLLALRRALIRLNKESEVGLAVFVVETGHATRKHLLHMPNGPDGLTALNIRVMQKRTRFAVFSRK